MPPLLYTNKEIVEIYNRHVDAVYRICFSFMKNRSETEDMVQETFLRLMSRGKRFENERHEKAWLIVTASNLCKDSLKKWWRKNEALDENPEIASLPVTDHNPVLEAILELRKEYKVPIYMYYYEGYSTAEIAGYLKIPHATVRSRLSRGRKQLKSMLGGSSDDQTNHSAGI